MKKEIHPTYRPVVFEDMSSGVRFMIQSTVKSRDTTKWEDNKEYPLIKVEVSSKSHPFYTGKKMILDKIGRVDRFNKRYAKKVEEPQKS